MITGTQMRAARALLGIDQRELAQRCRPVACRPSSAWKPPTGVVRGNVEFADEAGRRAHRRRH